ncbi:DUF2207 domain-containing protein [Devosia beringensis]|uniref:DUF2207 domain-containing protein n=1 Tax=Devosia beringensis TaxID=2657486 RepID=UPI001AEE5247|nr:DUF2207 domain-containing protein [Devosia beringensis]
MPALLRPLLALLLGLFLVLPVTAREQITSYASDIVMAADGTVTVTETIAVNAEGQDIRRGIYRDVPVVLQTSDGGKLRPDFAVLDVQRDGRSEPFRLERMGNFQRIWIGNPEVLLTRGRHSYTITYTMSRMARAFADHDELYWNVTGNYWIFPIVSAAASVTLPDGAVITDLAGYTGPLGSTEQAVASKRNSDNAASFRATRPLAAGEGLTIAVAFDKGVITYPTGLDALLQQIADLRDTIVPVLAALLAVAYNALAWYRVGRDPDKGTIIPLFHAPKGFSPALVHYVHKWGFANAGWTALTAAMFSLGVKGLVTIDNSTDTLAITSTGKQPAEPLPAGEAVLFDYLDGKGTVSIDTSNGPELNKRRAAFIDAIEAENRKLWFKTNTGYSVLGFVLGIVLLGGMVLADILDPLWLVGSIVIGILLASLSGLASKGLKGGWLARGFTFIWLAVAAFNVFGFALDSFTSIAINVASVAAISIVLVSIIFAFLMRAPTVQGRKAMDEIDGLKLYMETAEKDRMNMEAAPPMTASFFERLLPFAIALGVEKPWTEHFEAELARHAVSDVTGDYSPGWYHGGSAGGFGNASSSITNAVSAAAASMTAAMVASQPVQASSSGFSSGGGGGGGSSGGGGGGGGGGGW